MKNLDVRQAIKDSGCKYWEVAEAIGISDGVFSRRLRKELPTEKKQEIFKAIEQLKGGK